MDSNTVWLSIMTGFLMPIAKTAVEFAWGSNDVDSVTFAKRLFLMLPILGIIGSYWVSIFGVASLVVRSHRQKFVKTMLVTWWDMGRAIVNFWGGIFKFAWQLGWTFWSGARVLALGAWVFCLDLLSVPFKILANLAKGLANPSLPWIAVGLTLVWCVFEAGIFTFVTTPLVQDTLSNLTGTELSAAMLRAPLFLFMLFIVLGSYAVLSTWTEVLKTRNWMGIVKIGAVEAVAIGVEVMFLYREFVDALVPWFAQYSTGKFDIGIFGILSIATATWFGIRSLSWFLFASSGTPTIMAIIQGTGLKTTKSNVSAISGLFATTFKFMEQLKKEEKWLKEQMEALVSSLVLPPLQILAVVVNFGTILFSGRHLFDLPFRSMKDLKDAKHLLEENKHIQKREAA